MGRQFSYVVFPGKELKSTLLLFQAGFNLRKVNKHIKFPEILDLAPFCTLKCKVGETCLFGEIFEGISLLPNIPTATHISMKLIKSC